MRQAGLLHPSGAYYMSASVGPNDFVSVAEGKHSYSLFTKRADFTSLYNLSQATFHVSLEQRG